MPLSVFEGGGAGQLGEYLAEMVFGAKAHQSTDGFDGIIAVFQMLDGNIDTDGMKEADGSLSKLLLEQVIEGGFADVTFLGNIRHRKIAIPILCDVFNRRLECGSDYRITWLQFGDNGLQKFIEERIRLEDFRSSP